MRIVDPPATFWQRVSAWSLDTIPFQLALAVLLPASPSLDNLSLVDVSSPAFTLLFQTYLHQLIVLNTAVFCVYAIYHIAMETLCGTTLGKYAVGLRVCSATDQPLGLARVLFRFGGCVLSWCTLNIGHLLIKWRKDHKSLHDLLTSTKVVSDPLVMIGNMPPLSVRWHRVWFVLGIAWPCVVTLWSLVAFVHGMVSVFNSVDAMSLKGY